MNAKNGVPANRLQASNFEQGTINYLLNGVESDIELTSEIGGNCNG